MNTQTITSNELEDIDFLSALDELIEEDASTTMEDLSAIVREVETESEMADLYAAQGAEIVEVPEVIAVGEAEAVEPAEEVTPAPAPVKVKSVSGNKSDLVAARLGADLADLAMLTPDCAVKDDAERIADLQVIIDSSAKYVSDKMVNLFSFLKAGGGLNEVTARAFEVFLRDGQLVGGDSGNLVQILLAKPYSIGTARSQSNQMLQVFTRLKIGTRTARGTVVVNDDSVILDRVKTLLGK